MNLTPEDQACLIAYSRKPENLLSALAIGAIQDGLKIAIITEFLEELREYVRNGLQRKNLPWCVTAYPNQVTWRSATLILSITREGSNRKIVLYQWDGEGFKTYPEGWKTFLGGECGEESRLTREQLEPALEGVGIGRLGVTADFEWWKRMERDLGSDEAEALTTMNVENDRKELVEHYGAVLLKAVEVIEELREEGSR